MIYLIGDIHGDFFMLKELLKSIPQEATVVQVGDFGIWPSFAPRWKRAQIDRPVYFIDGNHDYIPWLDAESVDPIEIWPNAIYIPRGYVTSFEVDGEPKKFLFLGGSKSVDRKFRIHQSTDHGWFDEEQLTPEQADSAIAKGPVDYMVTHTPPAPFTRQTLGLDGLRAFDIDPKTWTDESAGLVDYVWQALGEPQLYCGHIHRSAIGPKIRSLDINEVLKVGNVDSGVQPVR